MTDIFRGNFTQQEPIPDEAIAAALTVLKHGRLHRYNEAEGEVAESALAGAGVCRANGLEILPCSGLWRLCFGHGPALQLG